MHNEQSETEGKKIQKGSKEWFWFSLSDFSLSALFRLLHRLRFDLETLFENEKNKKKNRIRSLGFSPIFKVYKITIVTSYQMGKVKWYSMA